VETGREAAEPRDSDSYSDSGSDSDSDGDSALREGEGAHCPLACGSVGYAIAAATSMHRAPLRCAQRSTPVLEVQYSALQYSQYSTGHNVLYITFRTIHYGTLP